MNTIAEVATRLSVCVKVVRGWIASGELPHYRLGGKGHRGGIRIEEADLNAFLTARKVNGRQKNPSPLPSVNSRRPRLKHLRLS
jgi:excisionase family DNA binding protein